MPELTKNEKLIVVRRRLGQNQQERAEILGVPLGRYRQWEMGATNLMYNYRCPDTALHGVTEAEHLFILRKRAGFSQKEIAEAMGVSDVWVRKMEAGVGNLKRLQEFWDEAESN